MATNELLAFVERLNRSGLLDAARLAQVTRQLLPRSADAESLARQLIARRWLTAPQARDLLAGRAPAPAPAAPPRQGASWAWLAAAVALAAALVVGAMLLLHHRSQPPADPGAVAARSADPAGLDGKLRRLADGPPPAPQTPTTPAPAQPAVPPPGTPRPTPQQATPPPPAPQTTAPDPTPPVNPEPDTRPGNLLVNGSFEEGPDVDNFLSLDPGSTAINGWTVTRGQIDYIGTFYSAADGSRSLDMNGSPGFGGIQQTFQTKKGQRYRVTFALAGNPGGDVALKRLAVSAAGKSQEFDFDTTDKTGDNMGWEDNTWEFVAVAEETTLELYSVMEEDPNSGPALDNVRVVAVPGSGQRGQR